MKLRRCGSLVQSTQESHGDSHQGSSQDLVINEAEVQGSRKREDNGVLFKFGIQVIDKE